MLGESARVRPPWRLDELPPLLPLGLPLEQSQIALRTHQDVD
jgi:hypothetical protein